MVMESDKMDFISTQQSNKDMEWSRYFEFLIKIACAHYKIDPAEINFPLSGSSEQKPLFETNNSSRLEFSKDKGLRPLLNGYQHMLNKFIVNRLDPDYELVFEGIDAEDADKQLQRDIQILQNYMTLNEIRRKNGLDDIKGPEGDMILNPIIAQQRMMEQQQQMGQMNGGAEAQDYNDYGDETQKSEEVNPILEELNRELPRIFS